MVMFKIGPSAREHQANVASSTITSNCSPFNCNRNPNRNPINQSIDQSIDQSINQSIDRSINQSISQPNNSQYMQEKMSLVKWFDTRLAGEGRVPYRTLGILQQPHAHIAHPNRKR
jgi:hypothetical protein